MTSFSTAYAGQPHNSPTHPGLSQPAEAEAIADALFERFEVAMAKRRPWEDHWQECYDVALPARGGFRTALREGGRRHDELYDGTAPDAVDQLAASLLAQLTPPWSRWYGLKPGPGLNPAEADRISPTLERVSETLQAHIDRSNFAVEMHQCYLDLVTCGTASIALESAPPGGLSAFRFTAVPIADMVLEEGPSGNLDVAFRRLTLSSAQFRSRYPDAALPEDGPEDKITVLEAVLPQGPAYRHAAIVEDGRGRKTLIADTVKGASPFINFRWLKAPGETYGRSPVMKALPDIKTANKVVELILKNASIAVTGIWQAEDDGVLNPANIELVPGAIIPKAVGSKGLAALDMPGRFDVSQLVLDDLRARIRHALLIDRLSQLDGRRMTATEVVERASEMTRLLGATYGRLQSELLTPLILRALEILTGRGEIPEIAVDGQRITLDHRSPLAQAQAQREIQGTLLWLDAAASLGPEGQAVVDAAATARWLGRVLSVPPGLIRETPPDLPPTLSPSPQTIAPAAAPIPASPFPTDPLSNPPLEGV